MARARAEAAEKRLHRDQHGQDNEDSDVSTGVQAMDSEGFSLIIGFNAAVFDRCGRRFTDGLPKKPVAAKGEVLLRSKLPSNGTFSG